MPDIKDMYTAAAGPKYEHIWVVQRKDLVPKFIRESQVPLPADPRLDQVPDMREILQDRAKNDAFARLVANLEGQEGALLLHKYENQPDELTDADWNKLDGYRYQLHRRWLALEEAQENISDEDIEYMLRNAPGMRFISTNLGSDPARMKEVVKSHLANVWMSLPEKQFNRLSEAVKANRDIRRSEAYKRLEETVRERVSDPRKNPENINWQDAAAYQAQAPKDERGWWRRTLDRLQGRERDVQAQRAQAASAVTAGNREILQKQEANRNDIMTILAATMAGDAALKRRVVDEASGVPQKLPQLGDTVMSGAQQMEAVNKKMLFLRHEELVREIGSPEFKEKIRTRTGIAWNDLPREQRERAAYAQLVEDGKLPKEPEGGGVTGLWLRASYGQCFNYMRKRLHEEGVFNPVT